MSPRPRSTAPASSARVSREPIGGNSTSGPQAAQPTTAPSLRDQRRLQRLDIGRTTILDAAETLFAEGGYQGTSLDQIAAASEYSVGGVYKMFASKEEIFEAVMKRRGAEMNAAMVASLDDTMSGEEKLLRLVSTIIEYFRQWPSFGRLSARVFSMHLEGFPVVRQPTPSLDATMALFAAAILQGQAEGSFRSENPTRLAYLIPGLVNAQNQVDPVLARDPEGISLEALLEIVVAALRPPPPRRKRAKS